MKPAPKVPPTTPKTIKRERSPSPSTSALKKANGIEQKSEVKSPAGVSEISVKTKRLSIDNQLPVINSHEEYTDNMDFSILEDDENQFGDEKMAEIKTQESTPVVSAKIEPIKSQKDAEHFESLLSNWENICSLNENDDELLSSVDFDETISQTTGSKDMRFWFWDAWEDPIKFPGKVFLFGKTPTEKNPREFRSVCIAIENVDRCLYVLPREFVSSFYWF